MKFAVIAFCLAMLPAFSQRLEESLPMDPGPLDFIRGEGYEQAMFQNLAGDALVGLSVDGKIVPRLADRWEVKAHAVRFHLRPGTSFSDGTLVAIRDVVWTLTRIQGDPAGSPTKKAMLEGVHVSESKGWIEVRSPRPPRRLLMDLVRVPISREGRTNVGSGPYRLERRNDEWFFSARTHYLSPKIQALHFRLLRDEQTVLTNLRKGWLTLGPPPARKGLSPPATHTEIIQSTHAQILVWSRTGVEPLKGLERWRRMIPDDLLSPRAKPSKGLWPQSLGFPVRQIGGPAFKSGSGRKWEIIYASGDDLVEKALMALRTFASRDGVELVLRPLEAALLYQRLLSGDFVLACAMQVYDPHPWSVLEIMAPDGPLNFCHWTHPRLQEVMNRLTNPDGKVWDELQGLWMEAPASIPILDLTSVLWVDKRLNLAPSAVGLYLSTPGAAGWTWR
jgi:hypothetical protein